MYIVFQNDKWCKKTEFQQTKQTENSYQSNAPGRRLRITHYTAFLTLQIQSCSPPGLRAVQINKYKGRRGNCHLFEKISDCGHVQARINSLLGACKRHLQPPSLTKRLCLARGIRPDSLHLTCFPCKEWQREQEGNLGLCYWSNDLCTVLVNFFSLLPQY